MTTDVTKLRRRAAKKEDRKLAAAKLLKKNDYSYWDVAAQAGVSATSVANTLLHGQRNQKVIAAIRSLLDDLHLSDEELFGVGS